MHFSSCGFNVFNTPNSLHTMQTKHIHVQTVYLQMRRLCILLLLLLFIFDKSLICNNGRVLVQRWAKKSPLQKLRLDITVLRTTPCCMLRTVSTDLLLGFCQPRRHTALKHDRDNVSTLQCKTKTTNSETLYISSVSDGIGISARQTAFVI